MDSNPDVEKARLQHGALIVGGAILAAIVALAMVLTLSGTATSSDKVALLGTITTFLGLIVGVFFGVNASGLARTATGASSIEVSRAASSVAEAARSLGEAARGVTADVIPTRNVASVQAQPDAVVGDYLAGDPDETPTRQVFPAVHERALETWARGAIHIANPAPSDKLFAGAAIAAAATEADANVSRTTNQTRVSEYLALMGLPFADADGTPLRYCAAGLTWAVCKAYCTINNIAYTETNRAVILRSVLGDIGKYYFMPSARCQSILDDAKTRGSFISPDKPCKAGYLVLFNWQSGFQAQHIGIVETPGDGEISTIEFNTSATSGPNQGNGGCVSRKKRPLKYVIGFVRTY